ncbi:MAG TPA: 50S ribosomal protein L3 [Candidatus Paceibacterota bacterium]
MKFLIATKQHMTQIFDEDGKVHPATVLKVGPVVVTQVKSVTSDGYNAVQVGFGDRKEKNVNKPQRGHSKKLGSFSGFREVRKGHDNDGTDSVAVGTKLNVSVFKSGDEVTVAAISKGKGFQGVVKRHRFSGGPRTHGQKHSEREPGSIGATGPQRVFKGTKMAGRMGSDRVTLRGVKVLRVDEDNNEIFVRGSIPGRRGTVVEVRG